MTTQERAVTVGCSYPSVRILPKKRFQATCSCGWEGQRRRSVERANEDMADHQHDLIPEKATPFIIRTGARVRVRQEEEGFLKGAFLGIGVDSISGDHVAFVQIGHGAQAFPMAVVSLEATG